MANQDKMIDNEDYLQLSEYCYNVCKALKTAIRGKSADDPNESVSKTIEDLERCVNY